MMNKENLTCKKLVKTLSYTTLTQDREVYTEVLIDGRKYLKHGQLQAVSVVGFVYKIFNDKTQCSEYWVQCGISKQHPCDTKITKEQGYEIAAENAMMNPFLVMKVNKQFGNNTFRDIMRAYVGDMDLEFIKTKEEIENQGKNNLDYNR